MIELTNDLIITFGKYWGKKYGEIVKLDKQYSEWIKREWKDLQKNIKIPKDKIEEKEEVYEVPKKLGNRYLCHYCAQWIKRRSTKFKCETCNHKFMRDYIPRIIILRHKKEIKKGNLIF